MADLLGTKLVANEFVAFVKLTSEYRGVMSERSYILATYALTGLPTSRPSAFSSAASARWPRPAGATSPGWAAGPCWADSWRRCQRGDRVDAVVSDNRRRREGAKRTPRLREGSVAASRHRDNDVMKHVVFRSRRRSRRVPAGAPGATSRRLPSCWARVWAPLPIASMARRECPTREIPHWPASTVDRPRRHAGLRSVGGPPPC